MYARKYTEAQAQARYKKFKAHPKVKDLVDRLSDWVNTDDGLALHFMLAGLSLSHLVNSITDKAFKARAVELGLKAGLTRSDSKLFARFAYETARLLYIGSGQINPSSKSDLGPNWGLE